MKTCLLAIAALGLSLPLADAATKEASLISAYAGPHNGTLSAQGAIGTTIGNFQTSKKKETGTLTLQTSLFLSGLSFGLTEQISFNKKSVTWVLSQSGSSTVTISGTGTARITKNTISYTVPISVSGSTGILFGTIKRAKNNHLTVQESISASGSSLLLFYQLSGKKPKK